MSITDELRRYAQVHDLIERESLLVLADRIDAALEEGYIELPKDACGATIRLGDKVMLLNGNTRQVAAIGEELFVAWNPDDKRYAFYAPDICRHVQSDSWERIIRDAQGDGILNQIDGRPSDFDALVERCKRLAGEKA